MNVAENAFKKNYVSYVQVEEFLLLANCSFAAANALKTDMLIQKTGGGVYASCELLRRGADSKGLSFSFGATAASRS